MKIQTKVVGLALLNVGLFLVVSIFLNIFEPTIGQKLAVAQVQNSDAVAMAMRGYSSLQYLYVVPIITSVLSIVYVAYNVLEN